MQCFESIVNRIKLAKSLNHDYEIADLLHMGKSAFAERKRRGSIPKDKLDVLCANESIDNHWLNTGNGWMFSPRDKESAIKIFSNLIDSDVSRVAIVEYEVESSDFNCFIVEKGDSYLSIDGKFFIKRSSYSDDTIWGDETYIAALKLLIQKEIPVAMIRRGYLELRNADFTRLFNEIPLDKFHPSEPFTEIIKIVPYGAFKAKSNLNLKPEAPRESVSLVSNIKPIEALEVLAKHIAENDLTFNSVAEKHKVLQSNDYSVLNAFIQLYYTIQASKGQAT